jgi:hypothetical protein
LENVNVSLSILHFTNRLASLQTDKNLQTDYDIYNYMPLLLLLRQPHGLDPREPLEMSGLHSSVVASKCICYWEWGNNFPMGRRRATVVVHSSRTRFALLLAAASSPYTLVQTLYASVGGLSQASVEGGVRRGEVLCLDGQRRG